MGVIANLPRGLGKSARKLSVTQAGVTGTGAIVTGLSVIDSGNTFLGSPGNPPTAAGVFVCVANSPSTVPTKGASIVSVSGGTVTVVVVSHGAAGASVDTAGAQVNVLAVGN